MQVSPPKPINLEQLADEIAAATGKKLQLGCSGDPVDNVYTFDTNGNGIDLPVGAVPVVNQHIAVFPPPATPNIPAIVQALAASPSIDNPTKQALKAALEPTV